MKWHLFANAYAIGISSNRALNVSGYLETVLKSHVMPYALSIRENCLFMQHGARSHLALVLVLLVWDYLKEVGIKTLALPDRSPDFISRNHT